MKQVHSLTVRSLASPDKNAMKKKQSQLKTLVQDFGKLVMSWINDLEQLQSLFVSLSKAVSLESSIYCSSDKMNEMFSSQGNEIVGLLIVNIFSEIEFVTDQIKLFS